MKNIENRVRECPGRDPGGSWRGSGDSLVALVSDMGSEGVAETARSWPRDVQATPKSAEKPVKNRPKEPKSSPTPPKGSRKGCKKSEQGGQEAAESVGKKTEMQKQWNVKIWFLYRRNS